MKQNPNHSRTASIFFRLLIFCPLFLGWVQLPVEAQILGKSWTLLEKQDPAKYRAGVDRINSEFEKMRRKMTEFAQNAAGDQQLEAETFRQLVKASLDPRLIVEAKCDFPGARATVEIAQMPEAGFGLRKDDYVIYLKMGNKFEKWDDDLFRDVLWHEIVHVRDALNAIDQQLTITNFQTEFNAFQVTSWIWEMDGKSKGFPEYPKLFRKEWLALSQPEKESARTGAIESFLHSHPIYKNSERSLFAYFAGSNIPTPENKGNKGKTAETSAKLIKFF